MRRFRLQGFHLLWPDFPDRSAIVAHAKSWSRNPTEQAPWFSLFRFRSPLLTESQVMSIPQGTEMFHFPWFRLPCLLNSAWDRRPDADGVAPFGNLRIKAFLLLPGAYRSLTRPSSPAGAKASIVCPYTLNRRKNPRSRYTLQFPRLCNFQRTIPPCDGSMFLRNQIPQNRFGPERHNRYRIHLVGVPGIEPGTSSLSGMRSNQLSYTPDTVPCHPRHAQPQRLSA